MTAPTPPSPEKRALIDAYESALKASAERRDPNAAPPGPGRTRPVFWVILMVTLAGAGAIAILRPEWIGIETALVEPPAVREASLRLAVALEAQRVLRYQREHGQLPTTLADAGGTMPGVSYKPSRDGIYEISAAVLYGERQRIWDQAENRRHVQKALLELLLG